METDNTAHVCAYWWHVVRQQQIQISHNTGYCDSDRLWLEDYQAKLRVYKTLNPGVIR